MNSNVRCIDSSSKSAERKPRLLDAFCGAGGCTKGYQLAGFYVVGVDIRPQPHYCGDAFVQADALEYIAAHGSEYDVIHASPPCQCYTRLAAMRPEIKTKYPMLIEPVRALLKATGKPYVMENVPGAPLENPTLLCGLMFDLKVYRHRLFETSITPALIMHPPHHRRVIAVGRPANSDDDIMTVAGHMASIEHCKSAMGIDWMNRDELAEAIPPAYSRWIGEQLLTVLEAGQG